MTFKRMRIRIRDEAHNRAVQAALFAEGYHWETAGSTFWLPTDSQVESLTTYENGAIFFISPEYAIDHPNTEYVLHRGGFMMAGKVDELTEDWIEVPEIDETRKRRHRLRSWVMFFTGILDGTRTSDIRYTGDREFRVGDELLLLKYDPVEERYTGREQLVKITYIQNNRANPCAISHLAIKDDYAVLSIQKLG